MTVFTKQDIRQALGPGPFTRGLDYQIAGAARVTDILEGGRIILGTVVGSRRQPYRVRVTIRPNLDGAAIDGVCSCPMWRNCKHVAALLLQVLAEDRPVRAAPDAAGLPQPLSHPVSVWLGELGPAAISEGEDYPPGVMQRLWYVLTARSLIQPVSVRLRKDGSVADAKPYNPANATNAAPARFLRPSDRAILRILHLLGREHFGQGHALPPEDGHTLLHRMLETGRCRWGGSDGPVLRPGPERPGSLTWSLRDDGSLTAALAVADATAVLTTIPPYYVDAAAGLCGPVATGLAPRLAAHLLKAPPLPPNEAPVVRRRLAEMLPGRDDILPPVLQPPRLVDGPPQPRLRLYAREIAAADTYRSAGSVLMPLARLSFAYADIEVPDVDRRPPVATLSRGGELIELHRDEVREDHLADRLIALGFARLRHHRGYHAPAECGDDRLLRGGARAEDWLRFMLDGLPALRAEGWRIDIATDFPFNVTVADGPFEIALNPPPESGNDWFDLDLGVMVDGRRVDVLPVLLQALRKSRSLDALAERMLALPLDDGRVLALPGERLTAIAQALLDLFGEVPADGALRVDRRRAADLAEMEQAAPGLVWQGGEALREMGRLLRDHRGIPAVAVPESFRGSLRGYQQDGLNWLQFLRAVGLGGILADDMGLGKTVQVLAHLSVEQAAGRLDAPCLVVAPTSLMPNWRREAAAFVPGLRVLVLHGGERKDSFDALAAHDLVLTTYALVARDIEVLAGQPWHSVIADEAQFVKNPDTNAARALRRLEARHRLCLSGTPVENHLGELWALFDFASPGLLGDRPGFTRAWRTPIEKQGDEDARRRLSRRLRPFLLRRTKAEVAAELPPKTEIVEAIDMEPGQRGLYESIRLAMHGKVRAAIAAKGLARSRIDFLDALLKLRQACCDPRLVKNPAARRGKAGSAKLERLMEMLPELVEEGRRILVFSQFTSMLDLLEPELRKAGLDFVRLSGDTRDRDTPVRRFQAGEVPLFLISLKAGGTGLNLTAADTVIHYDPWWNPAVEAQATDRAHRIGQTRAVFVYKLITQGTVEEKIVALQSRKAALAAAVFDADAKGALDLSDEDIEYLLG